MEGLIVPKSASLFLIHLDDVLVLHSQLALTHSTETRFSTTVIHFLLFAAHQILPHIQPQPLRHYVHEPSP